MLQLLLLVVVVSSGTLVGWLLGKPLSTLAHSVPGLNLLNLLAGLAIGLGSSLLLLALLFNVVAALAPEQFINEELASSWFVVNLIAPLGRLSWWLNPV